MTITQKISHFLVGIIIAAFITGLGNLFEGKYILSDSMLGVFVIAGVAFVGAVLSYLPGLNKLPTVFWCSAVGVVVSIPGFPGAEWITAQAAKVSFLATTTPVLAYAGLSLGKDIPAFRRLSWRIVPVALAVASGTFIMAAIVAEIILTLEGTI